MRSDAPGRENGSPSWETAYEELRDRLVNHPSNRPHGIVSELLKRVGAASKTEGRTDALDADLFLAGDPDNLISRVAAAVLKDWPNSTKTEAMARYAVMKQIINGATPATKCTLYNEECT